MQHCGIKAEVRHRQNFSIKTGVGLALFIECNNEAFVRALARRQHHRAGVVRAVIHGGEFTGAAAWTFGEIFAFVPGALVPGDGSQLGGIMRQDVFGHRSFFAAGWFPQQQTTSAASALLKLKQ